MPRPNAKEVVCQWLYVPVGGRGQVMIDGRCYDLRIGWLNWEHGEQIPELELGYERRGGRMTYKLVRDTRSGLLRCDCPTSMYRAGETCKHAAAMDRLLEQLVAHFNPNKG